MNNEYILRFSKNDAILKSLFYCLFVTSETGFQSVSIDVYNTSIISPRDAVYTFEKCQLEFEYKLSKNCILILIIILLLIFRSQIFLNSMQIHSLYFACV